MIGRKLEQRHEEGREEVGIGAEGAVGRGGVAKLRKREAEGLEANTHDVEEGAREGVAGRRDKSMGRDDQAWEWVWQTRTAACLGRVHLPGHLCA